MSGMTYFISHARSQRELALRITELLERRGDKAIIYERDFGRSRIDFVLDIAHGLCESDYIVCILSPDFVSSTWCMTELNIALEMQKLVPIVVEGNYYGGILDKADWIVIPENPESADLLQALLVSDQGRADDNSEKLSEVVARLCEIVIIVCSVCADELQKDLQYLFGDLGATVLPCGRLPETVEDAGAMLTLWESDLIIWDESMSTDDLIANGPTRHTLWSRGWQSIILDLSDPFQVKDHDEHDVWVQAIIFQIGYALGSLLYARGEYTRAYNAYTIAINSIGFDPRILSSDENKSVIGTYDIIFFGRAVIRTYLTDLTGSLDDLGVSIHINPNYFGAYFLRGCIHHDLLKEEEAYDDMSKAFKLDPSYVVEGLKNIEKDVSDDKTLIWIKQIRSKLGIAP